MEENKWISVKDELPDFLVCVDVWANTSLHSSSAYRIRDDWFYFSLISGSFELKTQPHIKITHCMHKPKPPTI